MAFIFVTTQEYIAKNKCPLQNCYPPESLAIHTYCANPTRKSGEPGKTRVFNNFENDSPRMLSWMSYVVASFSIAVITTTSWTDPASKASKLIMKKIS